MSKNVENIIELSNELRWKLGGEFHDNITESIYADASEIVEETVNTDNRKGRNDC